ncbi:MAG: DUF177 domain-containing protein [Gluconacetobacter diazotrophicus]|nr:DUF177 domain-containing protein [Gluconacetobacter diazotrophicus]
MREEVSRPVSVRSLGRGGAADAPAVFEVEADAAERERVARRLGVPSVAALRCRFALGAPDRNGAVAADGELEAEVERICVVSLEPFPAPVRERFAIRFVPAGSVGDGEGEEGELDPDADDEVPYAGETIDLGAAAVEQLALCLDPYPRRPGVELDAAATPDGDEGGPGGDGARPNPFAVLAGRGGGPH